LKAPRLFARFATQDAYDKGYVKGQRFGYAIDLVWCALLKRHIDKKKGLNLLYHLSPSLPLRS
jgi:hypothetical protein